MKQVAIYLLIFVVSFIYTYESIQIMANALRNDSAYAWPDSIEGTEKSAESEESKDQKEKVDFSEQFYLNAGSALSQIGIGSLDSSHEVDFSSTDYSQAVYSPPEELA